MDVLHVIHQFAPESHGGSESYLLDIVRRQRAGGLDAQVLTGTKFARAAVTLEQDEFDGIPIHRVHRDDLFFDHHAKMWHPEVEHLIGELLAQWRPRLLHVHHWVRLTCNLVDIARQQGIAAVVTLHDYYTSCPRAFRRRPGNAIEDLSCRRPLSAASCSSCVPRYGHEQEREIAAGIELFADHYRAELALARAVLVAVGSTADLLAKTTGMPRERYQVLPLGYHERFADLPPLEPPQPDEPLRFAYWGTVGRHKGVEVLLRAFELLHAERPDAAELHVLGAAESDAFDAELRATVTDAPVTFHGEFDASRLHAVAPHIGVFPSTCIETYGLVLDECFELGRPCITSDLGAVAERGAVAGLRSRAGDAADLAAAMRRFVDEPQLWHELAAKVPPRAMGRDEHTDALLRIYEWVSQQPAPEPCFPPVPPLRRVMFLQLQRETAIDKVRRPEGPV
ncbi:MAG: glycosyltransferase [Planctomycetes bacterium]|nr:glycosyltransferase [Planctomycetota bacterium]